MFVKIQLKLIKSFDKVLEVGPGGTPHIRSDVFLELKYDSDEEAAAQRAFQPALETTKPIHYYDGNKFPFKDKEFDYVICSHVLEHVENVEFFLSEVFRVAKKGYFEFPTIYYDYVFNIPNHLNFLIFRNNNLYFIKKNNSGIDKFKYIQNAFYFSLDKNYFFDDFNELFFQGFEWKTEFNVIKTDDFNDVVFTKLELEQNLKYKTKFVKPLFEARYKKESKGLRKILRKIHYKIGLMIK